MAKKADISRSRSKIKSSINNIPKSVKIESNNLIAAGQILTGIGIIVFWILFFTVGMIDKNAAPDCYFTYEHAFPPADIILAISLIISSILLIKKNSIGKTVSLVCSGALIFVGLVDFSFNLQNKVYFISIAEAISNGFLNAWCVFFGLVIFIKFRNLK
jgi:hypothetical protein